MFVFPLQVQQSAMLVPMDQMAAQLIHILADHRASDPNHKVTHYISPHFIRPMSSVCICNACLARPGHEHDNKSVLRRYQQPHVGKVHTSSWQVCPPFVTATMLCRSWSSSQQPS